MASLRIKFPEKDETSVVVLTGTRITVGRLPENTIQIVDRIVSSTHAELVLEGDHYHLRDLDSTNGTFVDGQFVTDYHLRAPCKIAFGTVECEFDPANAAAGADGAAVETLPTRAELNALKQENEKLTAQVASLREELDALRKVRPVSGEEAALAIPKSEYERVTADREALKEAQERHHQEIARLKENLALLRRDRENLQRAWEITKAELTAYRPVAPSAAAAPKPTVLKAVPVANPPMAKPPGAPAAAPSTPTTSSIAPAASGTPVVKATPRPTVAAAPQPAKSTQKIEPVAAAKPSALPKPSVKLGSGINPSAPKVVARPQAAPPPSPEDGTAS
jgi:cell division protein FtsB